MTSLHSKSRLTKSIVRIGVIVASLALVGNAFAANTTHVAAKTSPHHVVHTRHVATATHRPIVRQQPALAQFFGLFGLPIPVPVTAHATRGTAGSGGGYDPTFDSPSPTVDVDNSQSQAAIDASDQAMQQEDQSLNDLDASIAASEAQNDADNAATQQYLTNNGM